jgi:hypothetical protein
MDIYHNWAGWPDEASNKASVDDDASQALATWIGFLEKQLSSGALDVARLPHAVAPSLADPFQFVLVQLVLDDAARLLDESWSKWLRDNYERGAGGLFEALLGDKPTMLDEARLLWEKACRAAAVEADADEQACIYQPLADAADAAPERRKRVVPNRHVTAFHYLNDVQRGGETVFPLAQRTAWNGSDTWRPEARPDMPQCTEGLAVRPRRGGSTIFYHRHGDMSYDSLSQHGGCPPLADSVKYGANSFSWNTDSSWGYRQWKM